MSGRKAGKPIKHILEMHVQKVCTTLAVKVFALQRLDGKKSNSFTYPCSFSPSLFEFPRSVSGGILMFAGSA